MSKCQSCGGSYADEFKFCPHCGHAKPEPISVTSDDVWEMCEIKLVRGKAVVGKLNLAKILSVEPMADLWLEASAIGPQGVYVAASTERLTWRDVRMSNGVFIDVSPRAQPKLDALIQQLVDNGWQPTGRGDKWYGQRFKRKVKK